MRSSILSSLLLVKLFHFFSELLITHFLNSLRIILEHRRPVSFPLRVLPFNKHHRVIKFVKIFFIFLLLLLSFFLSILHIAFSLSCSKLRLIRKSIWPLIAIIFTFTRNHTLFNIIIICHLSSQIKNSQSVFSFILVF